MASAVGGNVSLKGREQIENTSQNARNATSRAGSSHNARLKSLAIRGKRVALGLVDVHCDHKRGDGDDDMREVHQQICHRRDQMQMPDGVCNNVGSIEETKEPKVDTCGSLTNQAAD